MADPDETVRTTQLTGKPWGTELGGEWDRAKTSSLQDGDTNFSSRPSYPSRLRAGNREW